MAVMGDMVFPVVAAASVSASARPNVVWASCPYPSSRRRPSSSSLKGRTSGFVTGIRVPEKPTWPFAVFQSHGPRNDCLQCFAFTGKMVPSKSLDQEAENIILNAPRMNFFERLSLAWKILFPTPAARRNSNAKIAKQRLKMILFSDRCAVSDDAKQKIVSNVVAALSDFVEIDSEDKVQLSVSTDPDLGTMYSVTVPVRRVKPEYQDYSENYTHITNVECMDTGETSGSVDVTFNFFVPTSDKPK
ncbi:cell division topological specificity factor homolog, chloroplastic [Nymphaea colorata]|nr:cell division topological specificity factor homolog, chloroplastic [Nymphaea colorata]